ncbi:hypothetical protein EAH68_09235 [Corynebacterium hylobatis]|uniref:Uncharacterized protein n=1 Tax=Corynebacterium hylobatis TaxID=1859290 RepID=A0A3S0B404_9CORY|nr:hypothetical protein [Corynebacterium hylobatis]RSZ62763.1 hypothetical protein EAH68_09235 [Corynebacterium hylobatis]
MVQRILAIFAVVALAGVLIFAFFDDATHKPVAPQGDMLGMDSGESFGDYAARAEASLIDAPADQHAFVLLTFAQPLAPAEAADVLEPLGRVNAMIIALAAPFDLPEPIAGETREDVLQRQLDRIAHSLSGVGNVPVPEGIDAVVAYDTGDALREVAADPAIITAEVLPPDAAWGRFGVRPVSVPGGPGE